MSPAAPAVQTAPPRIAAVLRPDERSRVDAAGSGWFSIVHRESIPEAIRTVREGPVDAVLVSVQQCRDQPLDLLDHLVRSFPGIPTVALVSRHDPQDSEALLHLGASGVRQVIDVTGPEGWHRLRQVLGQPNSRDAARIQAPVFQALGEIPPDARLFLEVLIRLAPDLGTARELARRLGVQCTTLTSRFARAGLPSPKSYLAAVRLVHAALLFERPGFTVADVAYRLDYSSPQSFGRHVRALLGITSSELRRRFPFETALQRFLEVMLMPYRAVWAGFRPLARRDWRTE
ncbi:MAG TPA: helix-turn-helix domain-containing protein [Gemmatimonadales bacterium]|nr:helix-turn-helix domain-containing protein [Gemmatimonadales bacterium]